MKHLTSTIAAIKAIGRPVALIDVDGVMQDNAHRLHLICEVVDGVQRKLKKPDWDAFHALADEDTAGAFAAAALDLSRIYTPVYLTARVALNDEVRAKLAARMMFYTGVREQALVIMREPREDWQKSYKAAALYKEDVVRVLKAEGIRVALAVDDSHKNCEMFARHAIPSLRLYNHIDSTMMSY